MNKIEKARRKELKLWIEDLKIEKQVYLAKIKMLEKDIEKAEIEMKEILYL